MRLRQESERIVSERKELQDERKSVAERSEKFVRELKETEAYQKAKKEPVGFVATMNSLKNFFTTAKLFQFALRSNTTPEGESEAVSEEQI